MKTLELEHRKYVNKFGSTRSGGIDIQNETRKAHARCSICVSLYGGAHKTDKLVLETRNGRDFLCCEAHRRRHEEQE